MTLEEDATLDDLLIRWHAWKSPIQPTEGYRDSAVGMDQYLSSRQHAWEYIDQDFENRTMGIVNEQIGEMALMHQIALGIEARNLATGVSVWSSPRLPADFEERRAVVAQARGRLSERLLNVGVMSHA